MNECIIINHYISKSDGRTTSHLLAGWSDQLYDPPLSLPPVLDNRNVNLVLCWPTKCSTVIFYIRQQKDDGIFHRKSKESSLK